MKKYNCTVINPKTKFFSFDFSELLKYRDLVWLFVKKNYSTRYKQTILGSAWLLITPLLSIICYSIIFGTVAGLSTDGLPKLVFYLSGNIIWTFFSKCVNDNSNLFAGNAYLFGKVYFPRLTLPVSNVITAFFDFCIQFMLLSLLMVYYSFHGWNFRFNLALIYFPLIMLQLGLLGLGTGLIITSVTTKYRDLSILVHFIMQIWMYGSPVVYSLNIVPERFMRLYMLNPVTSALILFKQGLFGTYQLDFKNWGISWLVTLAISLLGIFSYNKTEKTFIDRI